MTGRITLTQNQMKRLVIIVIVVGLVTGGYALTRIEKAPVVYEPQVVEKEVEVDALEQAIKSQQEAVLPQIEASAQKAYDEAYAQEMKMVELEVIAEFNKKLDARQIELEKETKVY